jgi:predicted aldo/keto reductase-like oxidoreductase
VYQAALDAGVSYVDTAHIYGEAETYLGGLMPRYREKIFLATKVLSFNNDPRLAAREMQDQFEQSLRRLNTTHVDLLHIHSIGDCEPEKLLAAGGPLEFVKKMKNKGLTRFIGVTGHNRVPRFAPVVESGEVDVIMVALNFADYHQYHFEEQLLPAARRHGCGIAAMKVFGGHARGLAAYGERGPASMDGGFLESALRYSLCIEGVAVAVVGFYSADEARQCVQWATRHQPLASTEIEALRAKGQSLAKNWGLHFGPAV